jgi:2-keto-4-pentenoate hydratase/2-oxohepta-3-ene-1,7-dioic acid hydratase in catechol pathway
MDLAEMHFEFAIDGELRQSGDTGQMLVGVAELIGVVSRTWQLQPGDLIFTGTPEGVGPVKPGQHLQLSGTGLAGAEWTTA